MDSSLEQSPQSQALAEPVERRKKKRKKKKKKEGGVSKAIGRLALGSSDAMAQLGTALRESAKKYRRKHEKSRDKKAGKWRKDFGKNAASAAVELLREGAKAPIKMIKALVKKDKKRKKKDRADDGVSVLLQPAAPLPAPAPAP